MIVWNRERNHYFMSPKDRRRYIFQMSTAKEYKVLNIFSTLINIAVPTFLYFYFGLNLILFGICFVCMDVVLNLFEQLVFITIPYLKSKSKNEEYLNKRIKALEKGKNKVDKKISYLRHKYCDDCERVYSWNRSDCTRCDEMSDLVDKKEELRTIIKKEQDYIKKIQKDKKDVKTTKSVKQENNKAKSQNLPVQSEEKKHNDYFILIAEKLNDYINNERYDFLISLRKSVNSISQVLNTKPNGKDIVPTSLYTRLDKIIMVLKEITELDKSERGKYLDEIKEISKSMSDEIQLTISQINKIGTTDVKTDIESLIKDLKIYKEDIIDA